ncbi:MAG: hypothetical protein M1389_12580 [Chloroflexi bacterium]|nr:hypothetical protein [Chloroflexota bacterium]
MYVGRRRIKKGTFISLLRPSSGMLSVLAVVVAVLASVAAPAIPARTEDCQYVLGFAALHDLIPAVAGNCLTNVAYDAQGNGEQYTANGMMQWRKADNWTAFTNGYFTWVNGTYGVESRLNAQRFPWEANPQGLPLKSDGTRPLFSSYLDDRSDPAALLTSYVNAVNQKQYLRAYSYWELGAAQAQLGSLEQFRQGYANTYAVQLGTGTIGGSSDANGSAYVVPTILTATNNDGSIQVFAGCYALLLPDPHAPTMPPYQGLSIRSAQVEPVASGVDASVQAAQSCAGPGLPATTPLPRLPSYAPTDIGANRYLDDRSDGVQVVRSYYNAINRHEYVRAFSYWESDSTELGTFRQFQEGFANTASVQLVTGTQTSGVGAGQLYYSVPVGLVAQNADGGTRTYVGCFTLHLGSPYAQALLPFLPVGIRSADITEVTNGTDVNPLLGNACPAR